MPNPVVDLRVESESIREQHGEYTLACDRRGDSDYDLSILRDGEAIHQAVLSHTNLGVALAHWREWIPEIEARHVGAERTVA